MKKILFLTTILAVALFTACTQNETDETAVSLTELYANLAVTEPLKADKDSVNFFNGNNVVFTARWNKLAYWTLTIKGRKNGNSRTITGRSRYLDGNNATWNGTTDQLPIFTDGDTCDAYLMFSDASFKDTLRTTVRISKARNLLPPGAVLLTSFDQGNFDQYRATSGGDSVAFSNISTRLLPGGRRLNAAQGTRFYNMGGRDYSNDYYIGALTLPPGVLGTGITSFGLPADTSKLYFNVFVYGEGRPNTQLTIGFGEDDSEPYNNTYQDSREDGFGRGIIVDWVGWRLVSFAYNQTALPTFRPATGINGNNRHEPNRLAQVAFTLISVPNGGAAGPAVCAIDYPVFTVGKPLEY